MEKEFLLFVFEEKILSFKYFGLSLQNKNVNIISN